MILRAIDLSCRFPAEIQKSDVVKVKVRRKHARSDGLAGLGGSPKPWASESPLMAVVITRVD